MSFCGFAPRESALFTAHTISNEYLFESPDRSVPLLHYRQSIIVGFYTVSLLLSVLTNSVVLRYSYVNYRKLEKGQLFYYNILLLVSNLVLAISNLGTYITVIHVLDETEAMEYPYTEIFNIIRSFSTFSREITGWIIFFMAVQRFWSIAMPHRYNHKCFVLHTTSFASLASFLTTILVTIFRCYLQFKYNESSSFRFGCERTKDYEEIFRQLVSNKSTILIGLCGLFYIGSTVVIYRKRKEKKQIPNESSLNFLEGFIVFVLHLTTKLAIFLLLVRARTSTSMAFFQARIGSTIELFFSALVPIVIFANPEIRIKNPIVHSNSVSPETSKENDEGSIEQSQS